MNSFERIHICGYRRLADVDLQLRRLNVMIGANGCGKTSLLDVFGLLSASAMGNLNSRLRDIGGIGSNLSQISASTHEKASKMQFKLSRDVDGQGALNYSLSVKPFGKSYQINEEVLTQSSSSPELSTIDQTYLQSVNGKVKYLGGSIDSVGQPDGGFDFNESALSQVGSNIPQIERFRSALASSTYYHALDVSTRAPVRLPQQMREAFLPGKDGEDLVTCLYGMRETSPDRFGIIEDTLRVAFPSFEQLRFPPVAAGMLTLTWKDKEFTQPFYPHQLSEGTLRFLWLLTLLYSPALPEVTLLDEPEVSLHPELLAVLADCLREASKRTQLFVATHSDRLVRFLQPEEVVVFDLGNGVSKATRADELDLGEWLKEYTLDQLWQHGRIGGRA